MLTMDIVREKRLPDVHVIPLIFNMPCSFLLKRTDYWWPSFSMLLDCLKPDWDRLVEYKRPSSCWKYILKLPSATSLNRFVVGAHACHLALRKKKDETMRHPFFFHPHTSLCPWSAPDGVGFFFGSPSCPHLDEKLSSQNQHQTQGSSRRLFLATKTSLPAPLTNIWCL